VGALSKAAVDRSVSPSVCLAFRSKRYVSIENPTLEVEIANQRGRTTVRPPKVAKTSLRLKNLSRQYHEKLSEIEPWLLLNMNRKTSCCLSFAES